LPKKNNYFFFSEIIDIFFWIFSLLYSDRDRPCLFSALKKMFEQILLGDIPFLFYLFQVLELSDTWGFHIILKPAPYWLNFGTKQNRKSAMKLNCNFLVNIKYDFIYRNSLNSKSLITFLFLLEFLHTLASEESSFLWISLDIRNSIVCVIV